MATWGTGSEVWGPPNALIWGDDVSPVATDPSEGLVPLSILDAPPLRTTLQQLSQHLPEGRAWANKLTVGSNTHALLISCAAAFNRVQAQIQELANEYNINSSTSALLTGSGLLEEWETSVGLPDECINTLASLTERRENIIFRLRRVPIVTKEEFETLGTALAGVTVTVTPGTEVDVSPDSQSAFKLYVGFPTSNTGFPYDFAIGPPAGLPFGGFQSDVVECIFNKIVPANVVVILQ